ncbi:hypothetical protein K439DRAFT_1638373 [Ramaria rubella]|nr:hypothetical protein K439DRAFT_1638373 [Ramaria rubella]
MSPTRSQQPQNASEHKKRKIHALPIEMSSSTISGSSRPRVARSPAPETSDSSSATLNEESPPSKDKGKAVEKDPMMLELEQLRKEIAHKNEMLIKHEKTVAAVTQTLTCQVCLELLRLPYALAPCGHVSCHACLVAWFTSSHNDHNDDELNPEVEWYSDDGSSVGGDWPQVAVEPPSQHGHGNIPNGDAPAPPVNGNAAPPAHAPAHAAFPNSVNRRKTCPHCRCVVKERPVQVYAIKDLVGILDPPHVEPAKPETPKKVPKDSNESEQKKAPEKDPWKGIFRSPHGSGHNGAGSGNHPPWGGFAMDIPDGFFDEEDEEHEVVADPALHVNLPHPGGFPALEPAPLPQGQGPPPPPFVDEEDGVRRCGACMHELWGGRCTNDHCAVDYDDVSFIGSEDSELVLPDYRRGSPTFEGGDGDVGWGRHLEPDVDDGYESSFIDDEEQRGGASSVRLPAEDDDDHASDQGSDADDFIPGPSRRWTGGADIVVISSDEGEEENEYMPGPSTRIARGRTRRIVDEDEEDEEQEVEGDVCSVDEG